MIEVTPTIYIGLGGSGAEIIRRIKRDLYLNPLNSNSNRQWKPAFTRFLTIDTVDPKDNLDPSDDNVKRSDFIETETRGGGEESVVVSVSNATIQDLQDNPLRFQNIWKWLSKHALSGVANIMGGAEQRRMLGRLACCLNATTITKKLEDCIESIRQEKGNGKAAQNGWTLRENKESGSENERKIHFVVFTSLAGGTGAGCFLDVCYMIRMLQHKYGDDCAGSDSRRSLVLYALLDSVFTDGNVNGSMQRNTYSCLQDINHYGYYDGQNKLVGRVDPFHPFTPAPEQVHDFDWNWGLATNSQQLVNSYRTTDPIAQAIYLIGRNNFKNLHLSDKLDACDLVARHALIKLRDKPIWSAIWQTNGDTQLAIPRTVVLPKDDKGNRGPELPTLTSTRIRTFGLARMSTERGTLRLAAAALLAKQEIERWVDAQLPSKPESFDLLENSIVHRELITHAKSSTNSADFRTIAQSIESYSEELKKEGSLLSQRATNVDGSRATPSLYDRIVGIGDHRHDSLLATHGFAYVERVCEMSIHSLDSARRARTETERSFDACCEELKTLEGKAVQLEAVTGLTRMYVGRGRAVLATAIGKKISDTRDLLIEHIRTELLSRLAATSGQSGVGGALSSLLTDVVALHGEARLVVGHEAGVVPGLAQVFSRLVPLTTGKGRSRFVLAEYSQETGDYGSHFNQLITNAEVTKDRLRRVRGLVLDELAGASIDRSGDVLRQFGAKGAKEHLRLTLRNVAHRECFEVLNSLTLPRVWQFPELEKGLADLAEPQLTLKPILQSGLESVARDIKDRTRTLPLPNDRETRGDDEIIRLTEVFGLGLDSLDLSTYHREWSHTTPELRAVHHSTKNYESLTSISVEADIYQVIGRAQVVLFHLIEGGKTRKRPLVVFRHTAGSRPFCCYDSLGNLSSYRSLGQLVDVLGVKENAQLFAYLRQEVKLVCDEWRVDPNAHEIARETYRMINFNAKAMKKMSHESNEFSLKDSSLEVSKEISVTVTSSADHVYLEVLAREIRDLVTTIPQPSPGRPSTRLETIATWIPTTPAILVRASAENDSAAERVTMDGYAKYLFPKNERYEVRFPMDDFDGMMDPLEPTRLSEGLMEAHPDYAPGFYMPRPRK